MNKVVGRFTLFALAGSDYSANEETRNWIAELANWLEEEGCVVEALSNADTQLISTVTGKSVVMSRFQDAHDLGELVKQVNGTVVDTKIQRKAIVDGIARTMINEGINIVEISSAISAVHEEEFTEMMDKWQLILDKVRYDQGLQSFFRAFDANIEAQGLLDMYKEEAEYE